MKVFVLRSPVTGRNLTFKRLLLSWSVPLELLKHRREVHCKRTTTPKEVWLIHKTNCPPACRLQVPEILKAGVSVGLDNRKHLIKYLADLSVSDSSQVSHVLRPFLQKLSVLLKTYFEHNANLSRHYPAFGLFSSFLHLSFTRCVWVWSRLFTCGKFCNSVITVNRWFRPVSRQFNNITRDPLWSEYKNDYECECSGKYNEKKYPRMLKFSLCEIHNRRDWVVWGLQIWVMPFVIRENVSFPVDEERVWFPLLKLINKLLKRHLNAII